MLFFTWICLIWKIKEWEFQLQLNIFLSIIPAINIKYVNLYLKLGLLSHFETPFTPVCVKAAPGWPKSEGGGVR